MTSGPPLKGSHVWAPYINHSVYVSHSQFAISQIPLGDQLNSLCCASVALSTLIVSLANDASLTSLTVYFRLFYSTVVTNIGMHFVTIVSRLHWYIFIIYSLIS